MANLVGVVTPADRAALRAAAAICEAAGHLRIALAVLALIERHTPKEADHDHEDPR